MRLLALLIIPIGLVMWIAIGMGLSLPLAATASLLIGGTISLGLTMALIGLIDLIIARGWDKTLGI